MVELSFKAWLETNEEPIAEAWKWRGGGQRRGPVGGAFGRDPRRMQQAKKKQDTPPPEEEPHPPNPATAPTTPPTVTPATAGTRFDKKSARIAAAHKLEDQIRQQVFDNCQHRVDPPSPTEDMAGIDGWWIRGEGQKEPIQIKMRDTRGGSGQTDVLFEVMRDYDLNIPGRDLKNKTVKTYLFVSNGKAVFLDVSTAKELIKSMMDRVEIEGFDERGNFRMGGAELKLRPDPYSQQRKVTAYIPVSYFTQLTQPCNISVARPVSA